MWPGGRMPRPGRVLDCVVILTASVALCGRAHAGELRGRLLIGERPAPGVTVSAIPYEPPDVEARRLARGGEAPRPLAAATTRGDGTFAVALSAVPGGTVRLLAAGGGLRPSWMGGNYHTPPSDCPSEHLLARPASPPRRVGQPAGAPPPGSPGPAGPSP